MLWILYSCAFLKLLQMFGKNVMWIALLKTYLLKKMYLVPPLYMFINNVYKKLSSMYLHWCTSNK